MTTQPVVDFHIEGPLATLTIQRPQALNALNKEVIEALHKCVDQVQDSGSIRVLILAGSGDKAFVAGADIKEMSGLNPQQAREFAQFGQLLTKKLESLNAITIAKVQGFALGGGCELAMACDIIIAARSAKFGQPEVGLGLVPGFGGTQRLVKYLGKARAMDILCTNLMLNAEDAKQAGLVSRVVDDENLDAEVRKAAAGVLRGGPQAIAITKKLALVAQDEALHKGLTLESEWFGQTFDGQESKDGMQAFLNKSPASFVVKI